MLTRFFGTSKPLAVIVVITYMTLGFFYCHEDQFTEPFTWSHTLKIIGMWLLFVIAMFILNFIAQKNELTKPNAYRILLFGAFSLSFPVIMRDGEVLLAGVFILIAIRRIVSLRSGLNMERKIFDASFWILIASLFFFHSWLFIIAIYLTLLFYAASNVRYLFIPLIAILSFYVLMYSILLYQAGEPSLVAIDFPEVSFDFSRYNSLQVLIAIAFLLGTFLWTIWTYLGERKRASGSGKARYNVILGIFSVAALVILLSTVKTGSEWYFAIPILAIIVSNYIEKTESILFKESLLWLIILLPFIIHFV